VKHGGETRTGLYSGTVNKHFIINEMRHFITFILIICFQNLSLGQNVVKFGDQSKLPQFPGGINKCLKFIEKNKKWPDSDVPPNNFSDKVLVEFTVDSTGQVCNIGIENGIGKEFDNEAIRIFSIMPKWKPVIENGKPITKKMMMTVSFDKYSVEEKTSANSYYQKANEFYGRNEFDKAIYFYTEAIEKIPTRLDYYYNRAAAYLNTNELQNACSDLKKIIEVDKDANNLYEHYCKD
jgi:tetratricopeptide (TPR) repeat protein